MRTIILLASVASTVAAASSIAAAQPGVAAGPGGVDASTQLDRLLRGGQIAAREGKCQTAEAIGLRVAELDAEFHARVYAVDPLIRACLEGAAIGVHPPGMTDTARTGAPAFLRDTGDEKSETTALALSLGGTIASYALLIGGAASADNGGAGTAMATVGAVGVWFAPAFGHWYAGTIATRGLGIRAAGGGVAMIGLVWALSECPILGDHCDDTTDAELVMLGGLGLFIYGTIDDIVTAPGRVREHNRRLGGLAIVPTIQPGGGGLTLAGRW